MSEFVTLGDHISVQKGKAPLESGYPGQGAEPYLNPDYLRGRASADLVKAGPDAVRAVDGDTILLWDGSNAGEFFRARAGLVASTMAKISPSKVFCSAYFFHVAKQAEVYLKSQTNGTGIPHVDRELLEAIRAFCPDSTEQQVIAAILDSLDTSIHETEAIIAKLNAVKQGLLHDLLTRGIDAHGELRPPHAEAPQLYKESPLGWIPKEWAVVRVGDDADIEHGFAFPGHLFTDQDVGPVLLVPGNFHREGGLYFTAENTKFFSGKYPRRYVLSQGDVLVVMTDLSPMTLILGRTVVLDKPVTLLHNQRIGKVRFRDDDLWVPSFFAEELSQDAVRLKVIAEATGTTVRHTSPNRIKACHVARPAYAEQQVVAQRIAAVDSIRRLEEASLLKLKEQKTGLMDDLLTGRVRVTSLLEASAS